MVDVAKRLSFGNTSAPLTEKLMDVEPTSLLSVKVATLTSELNAISKAVNDQVLSINQVAVQQLQLGGGRQSLKRQLQSLKSSLLNLAQKEAFCEAIKSFTATHDFKGEADRSAAAVESAEEDLKELKKANQQDEAQLQDAIRVLLEYHDQYHTVLARMSQKLSLAAQEVEACESRRQPPSPPSPSAGPGEAELEALLGRQASLANSMEAQLAESQACNADLEAAIQAAEDEVALLDAELLQLHHIRNNQARQAQDRQAASLQWCDEMMDIMSKATGVSMVSFEEDAVHVVMEQHLPGGQAIPDGSADSTAEYTLSMRLQPGSMRLQSASLQPASVDIGAEVEFAKWSGSPLPTLLTAVRTKLQDHLQRQQAVSEARQCYDIHELGNGSGVICVVLPNSAEAQLELAAGCLGVEMAQLLSLQHPRSSISYSAHLPALQQQLAGHKHSTLLKYLHTLWNAVQKLQ